MNENEDRRMEDTVTLPKVEPETVVPDLSDTLPPVQPVENKKEGVNPIKLIAIAIMVISLGISVFYIFFYNKKDDETIEPEVEEVIENKAIEEEQVDENVTEENETEELNETLAE